MNFKICCCQLGNLHITRAWCQNTADKPKKGIACTRTKGLNPPQGPLKIIKKLFSAIVLLPPHCAKLAVYKIQVFSLYTPLDHAMFAIPHYTWQRAPVRVPLRGFPLLWPLQHSHLHAHGNKLLAIVEVGERFEGSLDRSILLTFKLNYLLMNFKIKLSIKVKQVAQ